MHILDFILIKDLAKTADICICKMIMIEYVCNTATAI